LAGDLVTSPLSTSGVVMGYGPSGIYTVQQSF
jgi:hypothetical protein